MRYATLVTILTLLATPVLSAIRTEQVEYRSGDTTLHGYLAYDDADAGKRPGVLVVHEWWGLNDYARSRATDLAKAGYVALALDMYGDGKNTKHPEEAGAWSGFLREHQDLARERFMAAYQLLAANERTDPARIAAIGYCFGGAVVLSMAQHGAPLAGVVSFHGSLPTDEVAPGAVKAKVLVCHGGSDPFSTPEQVQQFQANMTKAGADWQMIVYGGAKHSFTNPGADATGVPGLAYDALTDHRSWRAMLDFFGEIFGR